MIDFRRGRDLVWGAGTRALSEIFVEPTLREVLRDPIIRSRMAADNVRIRDILDLAMRFRKITAEGKDPSLRSDLSKHLGTYAVQEEPCGP